MAPGGLHSVLFYVLCLAVHSHCGVLQTYRRANATKVYVSGENNHVTISMEGESRVVKKLQSDMKRLQNKLQALEDIVNPAFDLKFPRKSTSDYVIIREIPTMQAATVCLWINTADKTNEGTPFSYATTSRDNEFIIIDYRDVVIYIAQNTTRTGIAVNDGQWHHLCVTWENTAGSWRLYKDGRVAKSGTGLSQGEQIDGGGAVVLGNEQDMLGGGFHQTQSFIGEMSRVNMWRRELSSSEIARMSADCTEGAGDVFDWRDVIRGARGLVEIKRPSTCPAA